MPTFRTPRLDDRGYDDLRRELVRRIPVHSQEWTDHNPGDPGIAVLEVFAWLAENLLYRLNRVPDKAQLEFLNLLDVKLEPARPARAMVRLDLAPGASDAQLLPSGPTADKTVVLAGKLEFQVLDEIEVLAVEALPAVKAPLATDPNNKPVGLDEVTQALHAHLEGRTGAPDADAIATYQTILLDPPINGVLPSATAISTTVDKVLWIALLVPKGLAQTMSPAAIRTKIACRVLSIGIRLDSELCGPGDVERCADPGTPSTSLPVVWQIATGKFIGDDPHLDKLRYDRLVVEADSTAGFATSGVVRLRLPADETAFGIWHESPGLETALLGAGDLPPLVDDDALNARIVTWIRCFRPAPPPVVTTARETIATAPTGGFPCGNVGGGAAGAGGATTSYPEPVVRWVDANLVEVEQAVTAQPELLGNGTGRPDQVVKVAHPPVIDSSLLLEIHEPVGWIQWQSVESLAASGPGDPHYVLDPVAGEIRFGDGIRGRFPRSGEPIRARTYRYGGGVFGNVPAGTISKIRPPPSVKKLLVQNALPATGGVDGETVEQAKARIPSVLRNHDRAVAAEDFRDLAMETPAACLGRVHVLPRHKPQERVDGVPGVVTLIVIPAYDPLHPEQPVPDREVLRRVCAHLEPRRLVTTELYVTPPEYVPVWISVAFEVEPGYGVETVRRWVDLAIRQYLAPLPPYGPDGQGWPFGRAVSSPDIEAAVLRVEGVRLSYKVLVAGALLPGGAEPPQDRPVTLEKWQLPVVMGVQLNTRGEAPDPIDRNGDSARPDGKPGVPVPVIQEVC